MQSTKQWAYVYMQLLMLAKLNIYTLITETSDAEVEQTVSQMEIIYWANRGNEKLYFFSQTPAQRQVEVTDEPKRHRNIL
jgi:hypothetical protein